MTRANRAVRRGS